MTNPLDRTRSTLSLSWELLVRSWGAVRGTPGLLLLSVLLGTALWVFVTEEENPTKIETLTAPLPVVPFNVEPGLAIASSLGTVEVWLAAPDDRWEEIRLGAGSFVAFVDLSGRTGREEQVPVQVEIMGLSGIRVAETIPDTITVNLEDLVSLEVPVRVRPVGTIPLGYELGSASAAQPTVTVTGPESLVSRINDAVADLNITGLTLPVEQEVSLVPRATGGGEIRGISLDPPTLLVSIEIRQNTLTRALPLRASTVGAPAPGYRISAVAVSPATINVEGSLEDLQQLDSIVLEPIDTSGAQTTVARAVELELPEGLSSSDPHLVTVAVEVTAIDGVSTFAVEPSFADLSPDLRVRSALRVVEVTLAGPLPVLNSLTTDEIRLTVPVGGLNPGGYELELEVDLPAGVELESLRPAVVFVTLTPNKDPS